MCQDVYKMLKHSTEWYTFRECSTHFDRHAKVFDFISDIRTYADTKTPIFVISYPGVFGHTLLVRIPLVSL